MKNPYIYILLALCLASACSSKFESVSDPDISATLESPTAYVGEGVSFHFTGDADFVTFYSGETGNDYAYKDVERVYDGEGFISFACGFQNGDQYKRQAEPAGKDKLISFWWSDDFDGNYTVESIEKATWHDVTDLFTWPSARVDGDNARDIKTNVPCGTVALDELFGGRPDKPVYLAFRYKCDIMQPDGLNGRTRAVVSGFKINNVCKDINYESTLVSQLTANLWHLVTKGYEGVVVTSLPEVNVNYIYFNCDQASDVEKICWAVSSPIKLDYSVNMGCDYGTGIKSVATDRLTDYTYSYSTPGEYNVHFIYKNVSVTGEDRTVHQDIKVKVVDYSGSAEIDDPQIKEW